MRLVTNRKEKALLAATFTHGAASTSCDYLAFDVGAVVAVPHFGIEGTVREAGGGPMHGDEAFALWKAQNLARFDEAGAVGYYAWRAARKGAGADIGADTLASPVLLWDRGTVPGAHLAFFRSDGLLAALQGRGWSRLALPEPTLRELDQACWAIRARYARRLDA